MKLLTTLPIIVAAVAVLGTSAFADDQRLENRVQDASTHRDTTVAAYANQQGVGQSSAQGPTQGSHLELRSNPHGQVYGAFVGNE